MKLKESFQQNEMANCFSTRDFFSLSVSLSRSMEIMSLTFMHGSCLMVVVGSIMIGKNSDYNFEEFI
jgi:hypothetical protein